MGYLFPGGLLGWKSCPTSLGFSSMTACGCLAQKPYLGGEDNAKKNHVPGNSL